MDIMEMVKQVVASLTKDKNLLTSFVGDPAKIVKSILGGDLTDDIIGKVISGVKDQMGDLLNIDVAGAAKAVTGAAEDAAKAAADAAEGAADAAKKEAGGILGVLKKLF